jgi:hypothetical protein
VKIEFLQQKAPTGVDVELLLLGGEKVAGTVTRYEDGLIVVMPENGREKFISGEAIVAFETYPAPVVVRQSDRHAAEPEVTPSDSLTAEDAISSVNDVRSALDRGDIPQAVMLANDLSAKYEDCSEPVQRDGTLRWALISEFRALEYQRKLLLAQNKADSQALELSQALLHLNHALRQPSGLSDEYVFSDLYYFYVTVRPHLAHFRENADLWGELSAAIRRGYDLGHRMLHADDQQQAPTRPPQWQANFLFRLSEFCRALIECGFATRDEQAELTRQHRTYAAKAGRTPVDAPTTTGMGNVVAYGNQKFGFIQTRDQRTLHFNLRDVATRTLREQIEQSGSESPVKVDYDEEARPSHPYNAALRVRPPKTVLGRIKATFPERPVRFGFIALLDGRDVHFPFYALPDPELAPAVGTSVLCIPRRRTQGNRRMSAQGEEAWTTDRVVLVDDLPETSITRAAQRYIDQAMVATREGDLVAARNSYIEGLKICPAPHLVLAYAAWLKEHQMLGEAADVFERGMKDFSDAYQLYEHAGNFAASQGEMDRAIKLLSRSLEIVRSTPARTGEKGVLLSLARVHFKIGSDDAFKKAAGYYDEVAQMFGGWDQFRARMPPSDVTRADAAQAAFARLSTMSDRAGALALRFLDKLGLEVINAKFSADETNADVVCQARDQHLLADFGIRERVLVHLVSSPLQPNERLDYIESAAKEHAAGHDTDSKVVFLIAPAIPVEVLNRLKSRKNPGPNAHLMIIPFAKSDLDSVSDPLRLFRDILADWLWGRDVFSLTAWVKGDDFFGRRPLLAELHDMIAISQPIGLFGLRKTGKTSVLQALREREEAEGHAVLYIDMFEGNANERIFPWLYWTLSNELYQRAKEYLDRDFAWTFGGKFVSHQKFGSLSVPDAFFTELKQVLKAFACQPAGSRRIVLMLDEWEVLYEHDPVQTFKFLGGLRGAQQSFPSVFSLICTGANSSVSEISQIKERDNPVFGYLKPYYLPFLTEQETDEMIKLLGLRSGVKFEPEAISEVYKQAAGHPLMTRGLCAFASRRSNKEATTAFSVGREDVVVAARRYRQDNRHIFEEIHDRLQRDYPEELHILNDLAISRKTAVRDQRTHAGASDHLCAYQIVEESASGLRIRMKMLQDWLAGTGT